MEGFTFFTFTAWTLSMNTKVAFLPSRSFTHSHPPPFLSSALCYMAQIKCSMLLLTAVYCTCAWSAPHRGSGITLLLGDANQYLYVSCFHCYLGLRARMQRRLALLFVSEFARLGRGKPKCESDKRD
ncbi:hypothetical protein F5Y19DRAFT_407974 [Xylariaceae sp. FL1651]|nr:hypothetical protein F5Y19DRAFT_407974 [Xylariaceae sp. FL1651]